MDAIFEAITHSREHGVEAVLITVVQAEGSTPARMGAKMLVREGRPPIGTVGGGTLEQVAGQRALELLHGRRGELVTYALTEDNQAIEGAVPIGMACGGRATLFYDYIGLGERVFIFGGGHVGQAVAKVLATLPYHVTVIDHRPEVAAANEEFADSVIVGDYIHALDSASIPSGSYFLISTPSHAFDYDVLEMISSSDWHPAYVGMLGSASKGGALLERLGRELGDSAPWDAIFCPVGLDIGGPTPAEIAISVVAEMQTIRYRKTGHKHMRLPRP